MPETRGSMLYFGELDVSDHLDGVYAVGYRFVDQGTEEWTKRFMAFKYGYATGVRGACSLLPVALKTVKIPGKSVVLVTAIPSDQEKLPTGHPLRKLGERVADQMGWAWGPDALAKEKHRKLAKLTSGSSRDEEVKEKYQAADLRDFDTCVVLDDLVTRGSTLNDAARAIHSATPSLKTVVGVVLGKNEKVSWGAQWGYELNNDHVPAEYRDRWDKP